MAIILRATKGSALTHNELDGNFTDLDTKMGWIDYNDVGTTSSPIALTLAGTFYKLTNDGAGAFSNNTYKIAANGEIWNTTTDTFDFSDLSLGDTVDFRVDFSVTTGGANRDISTRMALAQGGTPYTLNLDRQSYKVNSTYQVTKWYSVYMGDTNTLNNGGHFEVSSDGSGATVVVNGWYVRSQIR